MRSAVRATTEAGERRRTAEGLAERVSVGGLEPNLAGRMVPPARYASALPRQSQRRFATGAIACVKAPVPQAISERLPENAPG
jgi:hypothetical protein